MACQGSLASLLKPPLQDNDRRAEESSNPDGRDVSALRRRIGRIATEAVIPLTRLWYRKCLWLVAGDVVAHFQAPSVVPILAIPLRLSLSSGISAMALEFEDK
jgi:hypothetical protein